MQVWGTAEERRKFAVGALFGSEFVGGLGGSGEGGGSESYVLGKGGIYLTTYGNTTIADGEHIEHHVDMDGEKPYSSELTKMQSFLSGVGFTSVEISDQYITASMFSGYSIKIGPFYSRSNGTLDTSNTWEIQIIIGGTKINTYTGIVDSKGNDVWRFTIETVILRIAGYTQTAIRITKKNIYMYKIGKTDFYYINGVVYKDQRSIEGRIHCASTGYSDVFGKPYLKFFCNPSTYTEFEQQITGCYPVFIDGVVNESLLISKYRSMVSNFSWIVVREVTQRIGYIMCTHITFESNTTAFLILDYGEQYADFVDEYLESKVTNESLISSFIASEVGE